MKNSEKMNIIAKKSQRDTIFITILFFAVALMGSTATVAGKSRPPLDSAKWAARYGFELMHEEFQLSFGDPYYASLMSIIKPYNKRLNNNYEWTELTKPYHGRYLGIGSLSVSYHHRVTRLFWIGGMFSYQMFDVSWYDRFTNKELNHYQEHIFAFTPMARFSWFNRKYVELHSGIGVGLSLHYATGVNNYNGIHYSSVFNLQATAIGVTVGRKWYGCAELGFGTKGIISAGFGYRFNVQQQPNLK